MTIHLTIPESDKPAPREIISTTLKKWPVNQQYLTDEIMAQLEAQGYEIKSVDLQPA